MKTRSIILLHGALGSAKQMSALAASLPSTVICPDLLGHGDLSGSDTPITIRAMAEEVAKLITEPVDVFGYSMGGYVALYLAAYFPDKVGGVVTLATKFDWTPEVAAREVRMLDPEKMSEKVPAYAAHLERIHGMYWRQVVGRTADMMANLGCNPALTANELNRIQAKTLLLRGSNDGMVGEKETHRAATQIKNARMQTMDEQPHPLEKMDIELVARITTEFLR